MTLPEKIADNELEVNQDLIDDFMEREHWRMAPGHFWYSYHNDWNMLMPVVERFFEVMNTVEDKVLGNLKCGSVERSIWDALYKRGTIADIAKTLAEEIKWYNSKER